MEWDFVFYLRLAEREPDNEAASDCVDDWAAQINDPRFEAALDVKLRYLSQQPRKDWKLPYFHLLHGVCAGLGELRLKHRGVQQRLLGAPLGQGEYAWLLGATEKNGRLYPVDCCETAKKRLTEIQKDRRACHARDDI